VANPRRSKLPRRLKRLWEKEIPTRARAPAKAEKRMVFLWVKREERNPDPMTVTKYPAVVTRIKEPDWTWERDRSFSIAGSRGAMMILPVMLRKKMEARTRIGPIRERKVEPASLGIVVGLFKSIFL
jgi:hypothetical protein